MKLVLAVVGDDEAGALRQRLLTAGYSATRVASTGGFMAAGSVTLLVGCEDPEVDAAVAILRAGAGTDQPDGDRGALFVLPVERFELL